MVSPGGGGVAGVDGDGDGVGGAGGVGVGVSAAILLQMGGVLPLRRQGTQEEALGLRWQGWRRQVQLLGSGQVPPGLCAPPPTSVGGDGLGNSGRIRSWNWL